MLWPRMTRPPSLCLFLHYAPLVLPEAGTRKASQMYSSGPLLASDPLVLLLTLTTCPPQPLPVRKDLLSQMDGATVSSFSRQVETVCLAHEQMEQADIRNLFMNTAFFLAITSTRRVSELHAVSVCSVLGGGQRAIRLHFGRTQLSSPRYCQLSSQVSLFSWRHLGRRTRLSKQPYVQFVH